MAVIMTGKGCTASTIGYYLVLAGAINWGLIGLGHFIATNLNLVNMLFTSIPSIEYAIYIIIGIAGVMTLMGCKCKTCMSCQVNSTCDAPKV
jgi:uncharacterized membrane protein YuzA (DUF378 family)